MRDFLPAAVRFRRELFATIQSVFESFGYQPLETPAIERLETLIGPHAEEGDRLIYRVLKRGDDPSTGEADLGLRYNFTVPLARVVAEHQGRIGGIFKAYQVGPVWRADRPGLGRFRESYHCDVDIVGAASTLAEAETVVVLWEALRALGLEDMTVAVNSRRVLAGLAEAYRLPDGAGSAVFNMAARLTRSNGGADGGESTAPGEKAAALGPLVEDLRQPDAMGRVRTRLETCVVGREGLAEIEGIRALAEPALKAGRILFDPLLARGLDYYTGFIFEIRTPRSPAALALGGRYDELIGLFTGRPVPACGGSLYMDRVALLLGEPEQVVSSPARVLVTVWDQDSRLASLRLAADLRERGIDTELFLGDGAVGRQLRYASQRRIPFALILGPDELSHGTVVVKDLATGAQENIAKENVAKVLQSRITPVTASRPVLYDG